MAEVQEKSGAQVPDGSAAPPAFPATPRLLSGLRQAVTILLGTAALTWLLRLLTQQEPLRGLWTAQVLISLAALLAAFWDVLHRRREWVEPMHRLMAMLPRVRGGQAAIEELTPLPGGLGPLVPVLQDLLHELRRQQMTIARLEEEMRQRVAVRTSALERVIGSLRQQATRDPLTGLFNRRFLDEYLPHAVRRARQERSDLCVLMIDIDHFKPLNDTLGHAAGDELLRAVGQLIRSTIRGEDVGFRCGGDEFVVVLTGCDLPAGQALAARLVALVDSLGRTIRVDRPPRLSIGVAASSQLAHPSGDNLLAEADRKLYAVKAQRHGAGRGRAEPGGAGRAW